MTRQLEIERVLDGFLADGAHQLADHVLDAALADISTTPQRRPWWPARRLILMNSYVKAAIAAAAVLVVLIAGYQLLPGNGPGGIPSPSPSPTATVDPSQDFDLHPGGSLTQGSYFLDSLGQFRVTFTVPVARWVKNVAPKTLWTDNSEGRIGFLAPPYLYADPCNWEASVAFETFGPTADDMASALGTLPGLDGTITEVTFSGLSARLVEIAAPADQSACDRGELRLYDDVPIEGGRHRWWVVDAGGSRLLISAVERMPLQTVLRNELQQIVDSIRIQPK